MDISYLFSDFPPELATFIISMLPISELRGAIPVAIGVYHLNPIETYFIAIIGNIIPASLSKKLFQRTGEIVMIKYFHK